MRRPRRNQSQMIGIRPNATATGRTAAIGNRAANTKRCVTARHAQRDRYEFGGTDRRIGLFQESTQIEAIRQQLFEEAGAFIKSSREEIKFFVRHRRLTARLDFAREDSQAFLGGATAVASENDCHTAHERGHANERRDADDNGEHKADPRSTSLATIGNCVALPTGGQISKPMLFSINHRVIIHALTKRVSKVNEHRTIPVYP